MECSCDVYVDDFVTLIERRTPVARKQHKCEGCREIIMPGEKYEVQKEVYDGVFSIHKTCLPCVEVRDAYMSCGYFYGEVWENLRECMNDVSMSDFEKFSPTAQQKILEKL